MEPQCMYSECHPQFPSILQYNANTNDQCSFVWNSSTCQQRPTNKRIIHASLCPKDLHNEYNHRKLGCAFKVESLWRSCTQKIGTVVEYRRKCIFLQKEALCVCVQCHALFFYLGSKVRDEKEGMCLRQTKH